MSDFINTVKPTPFGFFDASPSFQKDADKIVIFVLRKLGDSVLSVELTKKMIWTCFEEATFAFNAQIIEYQTKANLVNILGNPTGSFVSGSANPGALTINLTNNYLRPNLEFLLRQSEPYIGEIGLGQSIDSYSGSIMIQDGRQDYDLMTDLKDESGNALSTYMTSGSRGRMRVVEVFHHAPMPYVFNANLGATYSSYGFPAEGYASYGRQTRFQITPLFEDVLRAGLIKDSLKVRRSHYRYKITGRNIRFYPIPREFVGGAQNKIWLRVVFPNDPTSGLINNILSGSVSGSTGLLPNLPDDTIYGVSNPSNAPFGLINYDTINPWAKNWIFEYTMALCMELLGRVRSKFKTIPAPGVELVLNGDDLVTQGREDKDKLLYGDNGLIAKLNSLTYDKLAEIEAKKAEFTLQQLSMVPIDPKAALTLG